MKKTLLVAFGILAISASAHALELKKATLQHVYGTGWAANGGWVTPMTEEAADGLLAAEALGKKKVSCEVKGVLKRAEWSDTVLDYLAYSIKNCQ